MGLGIQETCLPQETNEPGPVSRLNAPDRHIVQEVTDLRVTLESLWTKVKRSQASGRYQRNDRPRTWWLSHTHSRTGDRRLCVLDTPNIASVLTGMASDIIDD